MASTPMSAWLRPECSDLWEQVDRRTTGTVDEDEDILWHAHARIEALAWARAHPVPALQARAVCRRSARNRRWRSLTRRLFAG